MTLDVSDCLKIYEAHSVQFSYPDIWEISEDIDANGDVDLTVSTDGSVFWVLRVLHDCPLPQNVMASWLQAFRDEYEDVDEYPRSMAMASLPADAREINFSCLELINSAVACCIRSLDFSLLVWWQGRDRELEEVGAVMEQMTDSVSILR